MNKNIATGILIVLYIIGIILFPMLYYIASEYYSSRYFFIVAIVAFPMSLFVNYIFLINIIIAKIIKKVKQVETKSQK